MHVASRLVGTFVVCFSMFDARAADLSIDLEWRSRYVFDPATVIVDRPVGVVNIELSFDSGWYLGTWQAAEASGVVEGDYTIGYLWSVGSDDSWSIDLSFINPRLKYITHGILMS